MSKTYDPKLFDIIWGGILMDGFAEGTKLTIASEVEGFSDTVGVDGEVTRNRMHDRRATATLSLMQTSATNDRLSAAYENDRNAINGAGVGSFRVVDRAGTTVYEASKAWISNDPDVEISTEATTREWTFRLADYRPLHGSVSDD